jgi:2-keto-3-deoxy-L-fuconate dehydrogenase
LHRTTGGDMSKRLDGQRVVVTQSDAFMGPDIEAVFSEHGAEVIADTRDLTEPSAARDLIAEAGHVDVLVANLAAVNPRKAAHETTDEEFRDMYAVMVDPLHRLVGAVLPQMIERRRGKVVVMGSASALRGMANWSAYSSARGAQLTYVQAVGTEVAPHNIQVNAIAQAFVENPIYFSPEYIATDELKKRLEGVPAGRLATGREDALLALFLASNESDFLVGQMIPFSGGWAV